MDMEMEFGDLEEAKPEIQLRPDRNKHYAVVSCYKPQPEDLPIYVDIDVMRDIEEHAQSNTNVELGGVMLGGQYDDGEGGSFVVVSDCLRAEHYEATKGSFKFTHETWEKISRQRDEFPPGIQMVGWYHTHPDWGVFLSGMDMFICDNFFNRPLDVALVVDPCRDDRGWFQWTGQKQSAKKDSRIRRTGGFYVYGSRFRIEELNYFAALWGGDKTMARDPRYLPFSGSQSTAPAPIVNIMDTRNTWQPVAVIGMLSAQFILLALIAWRIITPEASTTQLGLQGRQLELLQQRSDRAIVDENLRARLEAQSDVLQKILASKGEDSLAADWEAQQAELNLLKSSAAALAVQNQVDALKAQEQYGKLATDSEKNARDLERITAAVIGHKKSKEDAQNELKEAKQELENLKKGIPAFYSDWRVIVMGLVIGIIAGVGGFYAAYSIRRDDDETGESTAARGSELSFMRKSVDSNEERASQDSSQ
jgi:proteasome lid subunit RPN8/RPN11